MKYFNDDTDFSSGIGRFIHILTWPLRKFYIVIPVLALLIALPIFFGAIPTELYTWYKDEAKNVYEKAPEAISTTYNKIKTVLGFSDDAGFGRKKSKPNATVSDQEKGVDGLVDMPKRRTSATKRKGFETSTDVRRIDVEVDSSYIDDNDYFDNSVIEITKNADTDITYDSVSLAIKPSEQKLPLVYLKSPKNVKGTAIIKNSNELEIDNVYIVLYGIYVDPRSPNGMQARAYLETKARKSDIKCSIVAYTYQNIATAICFANGENLNKSLVEKGYSNNVILK